MRGGLKIKVRTQNTRKMISEVKETQGEKLNKTTRESFVVPTVMCYSQVCGQRAEVGWHR